nr:MAG TPA: Helicase, ATPase, REPLICATION [Caudoviricetes sp.]
MNYTNNDNSRATEEEKTELRAHLKDYVETITERSPKGGRFAYVCPLCGSGTGPKGTGAFMLDPSKDCTTWHCFSCDRGGDLFDLIGLMDGIDSRADFPRVLGEAREMFGRGLNVDSRAVSERPRGIHAKTAEPERDYSAYLTECRAAIDGGKAYLQGRGFTAETVARFNLGYDAAQNAITIPVNNSRHAYAARYIAPDAPHRYKSHGRLDVFNVGDLYRGEPCFVVEGQFDAMSIAQAAGRAVAIMGSNVNALYRQLEQRKPSSALIIAMDADDPGRKKADDMAKRLDALKIPHVTATWTVEGKDANERLVSDREGFGRDVAANVARAAESTHSAGTVADYLLNGFYTDLNAYRASSTTVTGFPGLDMKLGGLYAGLYVLGAVSALGKTTLVHQIADQVAASGTPVLYYSLEMSRLEMATKSLSRHAAMLMGRDQAPTALQIRTGKLNDMQRRRMPEVVESYGETAGRNMHVIECGFDWTIDDIRKSVTDYVESTHTRPLVVVDYLQIIQAPDLRMSDKQKTDIVMRGLKKLQSDNKLTVIVISALNRGNYLAPVDFESFKESGGIEYTADVVLGLQLEVLTRADFPSKNITEQREIVRDEKAATPRRLRLTCLKNRNGSSGWLQSFDYYPATDTFAERDGLSASPSIARY